MPRNSIESRPPAFKSLQKKLGKSFKRIREGELETKSGMAKRLKVSSMTIANWEKGDSVNLLTVFLYAKHQRTTLAQFLLDHAS